MRILSSSLPTLPQSVSVNLKLLRPPLPFHTPSSRIRRFEVGVLFYSSTKNVGDTPPCHLTAFHCGACLHAIVRLLPARCHIPMRISNSSSSLPASRFPRVSGNMLGSTRHGLPLDIFSSGTLHRDMIAFERQAINSERTPIPDALSGMVHGR